MTPTWSIPRLLIKNVALYNPPVNLKSKFLRKNKSLTQEESVVMLRVMNIIYAYGLTQFILLRILLRMICTTRRRLMAFSHETAAARISHAII